MTDLETEDSSTQTRPDEARAPPSGGRGLAWLALLLALLAALGSGYLWWLWWQREQAAGEWQATLTRAVEEAKRANAAARLSLRNEFQQALAEHDDVVTRQLEENVRQHQARAQAAAQTADTSASPGSWRLAETEYLLRIANHRLLMERDAPGAKHLLQLADDLLRETEDFAFHEVRGLLADEMTALGAFQTADVQGVFLRLEALKGAIDRLPLRLPEYIGQPGESAEQDSAGEHAATLPEAAADEPPSMLDTFLQRISGLVRFRRHQDDALRPLLPPQQADYLKMNLRLALDRAQLAALRHHDEVFRTSLADARRWLAHFVDARRPAATAMASELDELMQSNLAADLPDISRSLNRLRQLRDATATDAAPRMRLK